MAHWKNFYSNPHLSVSDFDPLQELLLTIRKVDLKNVFRHEERKKMPVPFIYWAEPGVKSYELKKVDAKTLAKLYGEDSDGWIGKKVKIHQFTGKFFGNDPQTVLGIKEEVPYDVHSQSSNEQKGNTSTPTKAKAQVKEKTELNPATEYWEKAIDYLCSTGNKGIKELRKRFIIELKYEQMLNYMVSEYKKGSAGELPESESL